MGYYVNWIGDLEFEKELTVEQEKLITSDLVYFYCMNHNKTGIRFNICAENAYSLRMLKGVNEFLPKFKELGNDFAAKTYMLGVSEESQGVDVLVYKEEKQGLRAFEIFNGFNIIKTFIASCC